MFHKTKWKLTLLNSAVFFVLFAAMAGGAYGYMHRQLLGKADDALLEAAKTPPVATVAGGAALLVQYRAATPAISLIPRDADGAVPAGFALAEPFDRSTLNKLGEAVDQDGLQTVVSGGRTFRVVTVPIRQGDEIAPAAAFSATIDASGVLSGGREADTEEADAPATGSEASTAEPDAAETEPDALASGSGGTSTVPDALASGSGGTSTVPDALASGSDEPTTGAGEPIAVRSLPLAAGEPMFERVQLAVEVTEELDMLRSLLTLLSAGVLVAGALAILAGRYLAQRALVPIRIAWERQQQFVADASHELRTPLSVVQAHAELLLRHPNRTIEEESGSVSTVLQESRRLKRLVDGLLTLARTDSNQLELFRRPLRLDRLIARTISQMEPLAEVKSIVLRSDVDADIAIIGDEERLHQLLMILIDNAVKYTPDRGIVSIACRKLPHSAQIVVEDTGVGIPQEHLPHIFDRFYRGDRARTREDGGTGLGLAIAKWIVERHGGRIAADSRLGTGTTVRVQLPL